MSESASKLTLSRSRRASSNEQLPPPLNNDVNRNPYSSNFNAPSPPPPPPQLQPQPIPAASIPAPVPPPLSNGSDSSNFIAVLNELRASDAALAQEKVNSAALQAEIGRFFGEKAAWAQEKGTWDETKGGLEKKLVELEEKVKEGKSAMEKKDKTVSS